MKTINTETIQIGILGGGSLSDLPMSEGFDFNSLSLPINLERYDLSVSKEGVDNASFLFGDDAFVLEMRERVKRCVDIIDGAIEPSVFMKTRLCGFDGVADKFMCSVAKKLVLQPRLIKTPYPALTKALIAKVLPDFIPNGINEAPYIEGVWGRNFPIRGEEGVFVGFYDVNQIALLRRAGNEVCVIDDTKSVSSFWCKMSSNDLVLANDFGENAFLQQNERRSICAEIVLGASYRGDETVGRRIYQDEGGWILSAEDSGLLVNDKDVGISFVGEASRSLGFQLLCSRPEGGEVELK